MYFPQQQLCDFMGVYKSRFCKHPTPVGVEAAQLHTASSESNDAERPIGCHGCVVCNRANVGPARKGLRLTNGTETGRIDLGLGP